VNGDEETKIEYVRQSVEFGDQPYNSGTLAPVIVVKEQTALSIIGLILAVPFPVLIVILWITLSVIKQQQQGFSEGTMNAVFLYLLQFFVVPLLSLTSVIIAFMVTLKSKAIAKKIGYVSFAVTGIGLIILGIFLNHS
jgi:hypothetical protein